MPPIFWLLLLLSALLRLRQVLSSNSKKYPVEKAYFASDCYTNERVLTVVYALCILRGLIDLFLLKFFSLPNLIDIVIKLRIVPS